LSSFFASTNVVVLGLVRYKFKKIWEFFEI